MTENVLCIQLYLFKGKKKQINAVSVISSLVKLDQFSPDLNLFSHFVSPLLPATDLEVHRGVILLFLISVSCCLSTKKLYQKLFSTSSHRALANATSSK